MAKKAPDLIEQLGAELRTHERQAEDALSAVTRTIDRLSATNESIDDEMSRVDEKINELENIHTDLVTAKARNSRIIKNFKALIEEEDHVEN